MLDRLWVSEDTGDIEETGRVKAATAPLVPVDVESVQVRSLLAPIPPACGGYRWLTFTIFSFMSSVQGAWRTHVVDTSSSIRGTP
jgi:hypothetical protein